MEDALNEMRKTYQRFLAVGLGLMLVAFLLMIFHPLGRQASLILAVFIFVFAFIPLEFARRIARKMAMVALKGDRKA